MTDFTHCKTLAEFQALFQTPNGEGLTGDAHKVHLAALREITDAIESMEAMGLDDVVSALQVRYDIIVNRGMNYMPFKHCPAAPLPPPIDRKNMRGKLAFREWNIDAVDGGLRAIIYSDVEWKEVMFASGVPAWDNHVGLYARLLHPNIADTQRGICGFVEMLGHIEEHSDGVLRAECARIISVYCPVDSEVNNAHMSFGRYESLSDSYPCTPLYIVSPFQMRLIIMREVLISNDISTV